MTVRGIRPVAAVLTLALLAFCAAPRATRGDPLDRCLEMVRSAPDDYRSYACFWTTARADRSWDQAARMLRAVLRERPGHAHAQAYLASIEMDRGEMRSAEELYRSAADAHARRGSSTAEAHVRLAFSYLLASHLGKLDQAAEQIERARSLMGAVRDPSLPTWLALREVMLANKRLEFGRALHRLREIEPTIFPDGYWVFRQLWLSYMGYSMNALGRLEAAYRAYEREADLLRSNGASFEEAIPRRNLSLLAGHLGESRERRLELAEEALATAVRGGNRGMQAQVHRELSHLYHGDERRRHAEEALRIAREIGAPSLIMGALRAVALALAVEDPGEAVATAEAAIRLAERHGDPIEMALGYVTRADLLRYSAPREQAVPSYLAALDLIEALRHLQPDPEVRAAVFGAWAGPYYDLASFLLQGSTSPGPEAIAEAFSVMERMRARTLLDVLQADRTAQPSPEQSALLEQRQKVLFEIAAAQRDLFDRRLGEQERRRARERLIGLESREARLRTELGLRDPAFAALGEADPASLDEVRRALAPDQALLVFQVAPGGWRQAPSHWLLAATRSDLSVHELADPAWTADAVALFTGVLESGDDLAPEAAAELYDRLLAEALAAVGEGVRRLVIVPDGPLHLLPFSALRPGVEEEPLGVAWELTTVPSASVWLRLRERSPAELERAALVLADPDVAVAGASGNRSGGPMAAPGPDDWGALPFARREARTVLGRVGGDSRSLVGAAASERAFKGLDSDRVAIVHVAAHAVVDLEEHYRSGILLAPGAETEDGILQIRELADLDFDGQLVVLSACRTAGGVVLRGEGVMSLARSFFLAGAAAVVGSLWPLPDRQAAELFDRFYVHLADGSSVSRAMSEARRELVRDGAAAAAWTGVVVLGDGDLVPLPGGRSRWPAPLRLALLSIPVLGALLLLARRRRRRG